MTKELIINCAGCDTRNVSEENYTQYENITINASAVLTNETGKAFLNKMPVTLNCANLIEVENDVELFTVNGHGEIKCTDNPPEKKIVLFANGHLTIEPNTENYLKQCVKIIVNGSVMYPESMGGYLSNMVVNGSSNCYPDEAIILKKNAVIDHLFALRAKNALYWSGKRVIMVDPKLNAEQLKAKGVSFSSKQVIIAESKVEEFLSLIDEKAEFIIVPDGTSVVLDDLTLDESALCRYGKKLYVIGDVSVPFENDCLDSLEYIKINGDAEVPQECKEKFWEVLTEIDGEVKIARAKGTSICDRPHVKITKWMLQQDMGIDVKDCMIVEIADDVTRDLITQRLHIEDCCMVRCNEEQEDAVSMISEDVSKIDSKNGNDSSGIENHTKAALAGIIKDKDAKIINAASYVM